MTRRLASHELTPWYVSWDQQTDGHWHHHTIPYGNNETAARHRYQQLVVDAADPHVDVRYPVLGHGRKVLL